MREVIYGATFFAVGMMFGYVVFHYQPEPCEFTTNRPIRPGMVIECPTGDTTRGCDTTYYYRLP